MIVVTDRSSCFSPLSHQRAGHADNEVHQGGVTYLFCMTAMALYVLTLLQLGRFTDLRSTLVLGGDKMDDQFLALHRNPDM